MSEAARAVATSAARPALLYALHSGNLYGTERMGLATAAGLADEFAPTIFAPPGPALEAAAPLGLGVRAFSSARELSRQIRPLFASHRRIAFVATGVAHSFLCLAWNRVYRRDVRHLHVVHGGASERESYGRKRLLNPFNVIFVAVSSFVRERLIANGVRADRIAVVENFLPQARVSEAPRRPAFDAPGVRRLLVISRVDPIKRIDLLLDALERDPGLAKLQVRVLGTGWELEHLRARAAERHPNVDLAGFVPDVGPELAASDLLVHLCPAEPFGLAILEAMAANVPVLVPDTGGAGSLVEDGVSGFRFHADDPRSLAKRLRELMHAPAALLNTVTVNGRTALAGRFAADRRIDDYRRLLHGERP
jgi:glycosyltransferase involved in cell wall biosynthesis